MFDELLLEDPRRISDADQGGLLWSLATAGAQVRQSLAALSASDLSDLGAARKPRAILVATDAMGAGAARLLVQLSCPQAPSLLFNGVDLPRWAGPSDALLIGTVDDLSPRLAGLLDQAQRRGLAIAATAPTGSQLADVAYTAGSGLVAELPRALHPRASRWSLLTPLLFSADVLGVLEAPTSALEEVADKLDSAAAACSPNLDVFANRAKGLAVELSEALPVIAGAGLLAGVAAGIAADALRLVAGVPAVAVALPDGLPTGAALLRTPAQESFDDSFFRDRTDEVATIRPALVTIGDDGDPYDPELGRPSAAQVQLDEMAARTAAVTLREIATSRGLRTSVIEASTGRTLARFAAATAFADFVATYLALGRGLDPSERAPGEPA
jgi:glucose/mannose-6-phosphate isomerase